MSKGDAVTNNFFSRQTSSLMNNLKEKNSNKISVMFPSQEKYLLKF